MTSPADFGNAADALATWAIRRAMCGRTPSLPDLTAACVRHGLDLAGENLEHTVSSAADLMRDRLAGIIASPSPTEIAGKIVAAAAAGLRPLILLDCPETPGLSRLADSAALSAATRKMECVDAD